MKNYLQFKSENFLDSRNFDLTQQLKTLNAGSVNQNDLELNSKSVVKEKKLNFAFVFFFTLMFSLFGFVQNATAQTTLAAGDVAIIGFNTNTTPDNLVMLVLKDLSAGTVFYVNDNEVTTLGGSNFVDLNEAEASFTVKTGQSIAKGTVLVLPWASGSSSANTYDWNVTGTAGLGNGEEIYVYTASSITATTPTAFIFGVTQGANTGLRPNGLTDGTTWIDHGAERAYRYNISGATYSGTEAQLLTAIGNAANHTGAATYTFASSDWTFTIGAINPTVNLAVSNNAGTESGTTVIIVTATASSAVAGDQSVNLAVTGTGITGTDYTLSNTSITILSGATTGTVTFTVSDDADVEGTETATLTISGPSSGITLGTTTAQNITITDNDAPPPPTVNLSVSSNAGAETGSTAITITATSDSAVIGDQTINIGVTGTNITAEDFGLSSSVITILNGQTTGSVTFTVVDDALFEVEETATLTISSPSSGIALGVTTTQNITITDNDVAPPPTVQLSVSANTGTEAAATVLTVTATASYAVTGDQTVNLAVTGTGITGADYSLSNTQITILSGATTGSVTFTILDDAADEGTETATLTISNPSLGITLGTTIAQNISITDNDAPPVTIIEAGDISVIGYNLSGTPNDNFTILFHKDLNSGTVFYINDNEIAIAGSSTFTDLNEGEISFTVKPGQTIAKGTVISIPWGTVAVSTSTYDLSSSSGAGLGSSGDELYIYNASSITATTASSFICFAKIGNSPSAVPTGLISGTTSITPTLVPASRYKISGALYNACQADLLVAIGNTATNWEAVAPGAAADWTFTLLSTCAPVIPTVALSISTNSGSEAGTTAITVTATTSSAVSVDQTVALGVSGTDITTGDYSLSNSTITIVNGQTTGSVTFTVGDDILVEGSETAVLTISDPSSGLTLGTTTSQNITITDNDVAPNLNIDLSTYVRVGRYNLPEPTRTAAPTNNLLCQEASAVAYNWDTDTLFITADGSTSITQVSKTGELIDTMTMAQGGSPQGTEFYDTEGLTYIGNGQFVMSEERDRQLVKFTYAAGTTLTRANTQTVKIGTFVPNTGTEGLSYDPLTGGYIVLKEITPIGIFQTGVDFNAGTATNGSATTENSTNLFDPALLGFSDVADVFALSNLPLLNGQSLSNNLLVLGQENAKVVNVDRNGVIANALTIVSDAGNPLDVASQQHEGLTMDREGNLYIVSENGGGTIDYPQLWVYAPSTVPNQAPTAIALTNTTTAILENSNTTAAVKVADITVTDDGLGANTLTLSGADANSFQITGSSLYIKAGTVLDYETQTSYNVTINVDDTTIGNSPDASVNYVLNVTDVLLETAPIVSVSITEAAPWSSGNANVLADWFEVTNNGNAPLDITGWKVDDSSNSFTAALALTGITSIAAGESVIFLETTSTNAATIIANFKSAWFGSNVPSGLQVGSYTGTGIGLGTGGDAVNLFNSAGVVQANISFGAATTNFTFNNAANLNNTAITTLSQVGVNDAFKAVNDTNQIGSPGTIGRLFISEVAPWSSGNSPVGVDWFEVTNTKAVAVDITGWKVDDNSQSPAAAIALNGITSINPGESVIFMETADLAGKTTAFLNNWFGTNPSSGLRIGNYTGTGIGFGTGGDQVNLYNGVSSTPVSSVLFGASPTAAPFTTFDNAIGQNSLVTPITQFSAVSVNGAFIAANSTTEIGSPGTIKTAPCPTITATATPASSSVCVGATTTLSVTATGGTTPYTVTGSSLTVGAGTYNYTVTDAKGCTAVTSVTINTTDLAASSTAGTISCFGESTTLVVSATGGTAPYTGTGSFTVSAGAYSYTVTDANGCSSTTTGTVSQPSQLTNSTIETACDTFTWAVNGQTYTTSGTYTGTATNGSGCSVQETLNLTVNQLVVYYADADGDGFGNASSSTNACSQPTAYVTNNTDCDDSDSTKNATFTFYADADGDTYGAGSAVTLCAVNATTPPSGYSVNNTDCVDTNTAINPGATEIFDTIDNDCDGLIDEGTTLAAPGVTNLTVCVGSPSVTLTATALSGYTLRWYAAATGGTALTTTPVVVTTAAIVKSFWVSQKLGTGLESARVQITVTVVALPATPGTITGTVAICNVLGSTTELTYSIAAVTGATSYVWTVPTGANILSGQGSTSVTVNFAGVAQGITALTLGVRSENATGCLSVAKTLSLTRVLPVAPASVTLTNPASATPATAITAVGPFIGTTTELTLTAAVTASANSYSWTLPAGVNVISGNPATDRVLVINFANAASGVTSITASVVSVSGCGNSIAKALVLTKVLPAKPAAITTTQTNVCLIAGSESTVTYTVVPVVGAFANGYTWTVPTGASIVGSATGNSIVVSYSSNFNAAGSVTVTSSNGVGTSATAATLAVAATAPLVPATLVMTLAPSTTAVVAAGPFMGTSTVLTLTAAPVAGAVSYAWTLPAGVNQVSGGTERIITVNFPDVVTPTGITALTISVKAVNGCGLQSAAKALSLTRALPAKPAAITTTQTNVCLIAGSESTVTYTVAPVAGAFAYGYTWTVPTGASIVGTATGNSIVVSYSSNFNAAGSVTVTSSNGVGTSATAATLAVAATAPLVPATLVMTLAPSTTAVVAAGPFMGTSTVLTLTAAPVAGAVSYAWTLPAGVNQVSGGTERIITVNFADVVTPTGITALPISVKAVNGCGLQSVAKALSLTRALPVKPAAVTTTLANVCAIAGTNATVTYSVAPVAGAFANGYAWTVPTGGTIVSGQGSTSIAVSYAGNFTAGNVSVTSSNGVGTSLTPTTLAVARTSGAVAPAALVGQVAGLCAGTAYNYSFAAGANAQTYTITGPVGSVVTSADNASNTSNVITTSNLAFTVVYPTTAIVNISIVANNPCGSAAAKLFVVSKAMGAITTISGPTAVDTCSEYTYTASVVVGAVAYTWTVPSGAQIVSGQGTNTLVVTFPGTLATGAVLKVLATNGCSVSSALKSSSVLTRTTCPAARSEVVLQEVTKTPFSVKAYPNPYSENFNLSVTTSSEDKVGIVVYDMTGRLIERRDVRPSDMVEQQIGDRYPSGVYNVVITQGQEVKTLRVIKR